LESSSVKIGSGARHGGVKNPEVFFYERDERSTGALRRLFFPQSQIAQLDCSICTGEEADEARTNRDDPRRIDIGQNPDVDEPGL
jgi:hypothetical protein